LGHRLRGWITSGSLPEVFQSIVVPAGAKFWGKIGDFTGPGYLVAVGYIIPAIGRPISSAVRDTIRLCAALGNRHRKPAGDFSADPVLLDPRQIRISIVAGRILRTNEPQQPRRLVA
jgi:hypothetical protein